MPLPRKEPSTSVRPSGLVAPAVDLTGVTELRVHGVGGTTPEMLLDDLAPQRVSGDSIAGFYRTSDAAGRHVEAYSWGGLTSRSATRVLWLLLLPFALANLAGWMVLPREDGVAAAGVLVRWSLRLTALATTLNAVLLAALAALDVFAYQCGGQPSCHEQRWWLAPLGWSTLDGRPGRLVVLGALAPILLVSAFAALSARTRSRYESVRPPWRGDDEPPRPAASAASLAGGMAHPDFWNGAPAHARLTRLHVAAALALVTLVVTHCARTSTVASGQTAWPVLWLVLLAAGGLVLLLTAVFLVAEREPRPSTTWLLVAAVVALLLALLYASVQPAAPHSAGHLPGMRASVNATYAAVLLSLAPLLVVTVRAEFRARRRPSDRQRFRWGAPFIVTAAAVLLLNVVLLSVLVVVATLLGDVRWCTEGCAPTAGGTTVVDLFAIVRVAVTWLTLAPLGAILAFAAIELALYLRAGGRRQLLADVQREYRAMEDDERLPPEPVLRWVVSALRDARGGSPTKWTRTVARSRRLAASIRDVSYLLTALVATAVGVVVVYEILIWFLDVPVPPGATTLGVVVASLVPVAGVLLMRSAWRRLDQRRLIGILWDVGTFWPRAYHPLAPPSYSERAVPELLRRIWFLHDNGGRVLLAAHSQGTVLAAAALARQGPGSEGPDVGSAVALATFGSPLRTLYAWAFPSYVTSALLERIAAGAGPVGPREWLNTWYPSDLIGGPVLPEGSRHAAATVELRLPDPASSRYVYGGPPPPVTGHSGYWSDPRMWRRVDGLAARQRAAPERGP